MASISPFFTAATAESPVPTPIIDTSSGLTPSRAISALTKKLVEEPGALTPIFMPLRSPNDLTCAALSLRTASTMPGKRPSSITAAMS